MYDADIQFIGLFDSRGLLYVAMTRAEDMLVILHSGSSSYVEELYRALGTVPP